MIVKVWLRQGHRSRAETQAIRSFNCRTSLQQLHLLEQSHQWQIRGNTVWRWKQTLRKVVQFVSQLNGGSNEFEQYFEIVSALNWIYYIYMNPVLIVESEADMSPAATMHSCIDQILRVADWTAVFIYVRPLPLPEICPAGLQATHQNWTAEVVRSSVWHCQWKTFQHFPELLSGH